MTVRGRTLQICTIGFFCAVLVLGMPVWAAGQKISTEPGGGTHITPQVNGTSVVWADINDNTGIYRYDICSRRVTKISSSQAVDPYGPQVSGNTVIWGDYRDMPQLGVHGLVRYDISTRKEMPLPHNTFGTQARPADQMDPAISGNIVAFWTENPWGSGGSHEIYAYYLGTRLSRGKSPAGGPFGPSYFKPISISSNNEIKERPRISGDKIVWADDRNDVVNQKSDIWLYDLSTNLETRISTTSNTKNTNPDISGNRVVWEESDPPYTSADIVLYDIPTRTITRITNDQWDHRHPAISGNRIVWDDNRDYQTSGLDIYSYNIKTGVTSRITTDPNDQQYPDNDGSHLVWQDPRGVYIFRSGFIDDFFDQLYCNLHELPLIIPVPYH